VVGQTVKVLIDEKVKGEKDEFMGRTEGDAPEVDGTVYVSGKGLKVGQFYDVSITGSTEYDLIGQV
jgi:ribosomal protein S12 methylthiotransferase